MPQVTISIHNKLVERTILTLEDPRSMKAQMRHDNKAALILKYVCYGAEFYEDTRLQGFPTSLKTNKNLPDTEVLL
jgi:hypothetical protein